MFICFSIEKASILLIFLTSKIYFVPVYAKIVSDFFRSEGLVSIARIAFHESIPNDGGFYPHSS